MKYNKKVEYKKELCVSLVAITFISFTLLSLKSPVETPLVQEKNTAEENLKNKIVKRAPSNQEDDTKRFRNIINLNKKVDHTIAKLKEIEKCLEIECNYPSNDPLEYSLSVYKDLSLNISKNKNFWVKSWSKIPSDQKKYLTELLSHDDGFVKEEILSLISKLPFDESSKHLDLVLEHVIGYHDSKLIPEALKFISTTTTSENELKVSKSLSKALKQGGPHVSQEISKHIGNFISSNTANLYSNILPQMPESAPETVYLSSALTEYEMKKSGG